MLFNSCCVNFYEEDFLLLFSSLWLLPGFPAATSAKQIRLHLKGNMLAYYCCRGRGSRKVLWAAAHRLSSNAFIIFIICSSHTSPSSSSSFSSTQIQKQFLNLQCSLEVWFFSPFIQWLFFSKTKVEKPIRKLISRLTFLLSLPLMKRQRRHLPQNNDIFSFAKMWLSDNQCTFRIWLI